MCLYSNKTFKTFEQAKVFTKNLPRTTRDITVYKGLYEITPTQALAPYQHIRYDKGFHYYQTGRKPLGINITTNHLGHYRLCVNVGLHACLTKTRAHLHGSFIVKMIIPKGSTLIRGDEGEVVTDNLIWY